MSSSRPPRELPALAFGWLPETRRYRLRVARYAAMSEAVEQEIRSRGTAKVALLDIGVGRGRSLRFMEATGLLDQVDMYGLDIGIRPDLHKPKDWRLVVADAGKPLPLADSSMDIVLFEQVLEHLWDIETPVREIERVLRPGGLLVLGVPTFPRPLAALRQWWITTFPERHARGKSEHHQTFSCGTIMTHVRRTTSLQVLRVRGFRVISGGLLEWLEDYRWWYRLSLFVARLLPWFCTEVQLVARKPG